MLRNWVQCSVGEEGGREWGMQGGEWEKSEGKEGEGGRREGMWQSGDRGRERERCVCQDCVCLCARVPRRRQTLAALSELTGPSPLPLLVAQGGRTERERGE